MRSIDSVCQGSSTEKIRVLYHTSSKFLLTSQNPNHPLTVSFAYILIRIITYIMILNGMYQNTFSLKCKLFHDKSFQISGVRYFYNIRSKMFSSAITEWNTTVHDRTSFYPVRKINHISDKYILLCHLRKKEYCCTCRRGTKYLSGWRVEDNEQSTFV